MRDRYIMYLGYSGAVISAGAMTLRVFFGYDLAGFEAAGILVLATCAVVLAFRNTMAPGGGSR